MDYFVVFIVGLVAFFAASISAGGASLIILPVLIGLGLNPTDAIGTNIFGALGFVLGTALSSHARSVVRRDRLRPIILMVIVASITSPLIVLSLSQDAVKTVSGILIVFTAIMSILTWRLASHSRKVSKTSLYLGYFIYFVLLATLSGFGSGIGVLMNYVLIVFVGMSVLESTTTARIAGIVGLSIQSIIYIVHGHVLFDYGMVLAVSGLIGAYFGINFAIKKGNEFVKKAMAVAAILLVLLLFI